MKNSRKIDPQTGQPYGPDYTEDGKISLHGSKVTSFNGRSYEPKPYFDELHEEFERRRQWNKRKK